MAAEFVQRSRLLVEQAQYEEAVRVCRLGLLANPGEIEGRLVLGSALIALSRYNEVLAEMRIALDMDPANPSAMALKGEAMLRKGDADQAVAVLAQAAATAPGDPYVERLRTEAAMAARGAPRIDSTFDIDPEIEGVELDGDLLVEESGEIELSSDDLLVAEDPARAVGTFDGGAGHTRDLGGRGSRGRARLPDPFAKTALAFDPVDALSDYDPSSRDHRSASGQVSAAPKRQDTIGSLFPEDERGVSSLEIVDVDSGEPRAMHKQSRPGERAVPDLQALHQSTSPRAGAGPERSMTDDMKLIRRGLGVGGEAGDGSARATAPRPVSMAKSALAEPRRERLARPVRRIPLGGWLALGLVVVSGGVFAGLEIREFRLERQVASLRAQASQLAAKDTYLSLRQARDLYGRIVRVRPDDDHRAALARALATLAAEFGDGRAEAKAVLEGLGAVETFDAWASRAYLALAAGNSAELLQAANAVVKNHPEKAIGHYLLGRGYLLEGDAEMAASALQKSIDLQATPFGHLALARAEAMRGRYAEALAAVARASDVAPNHPAALIWQARILAQSGQLPANPSDPDDVLDAMVKAPADAGDPLSLSPAQRAWAGLVLAEIKLRRGDFKAASIALAQAKMARSSDWMFSEVLAEVMLALGDIKGARAEAQKSLETWPARTGIRIVLARAALAEGDPAAAGRELEQFAHVEATPEGLTVRGIARLELGQVDLAAADLDKALELRPGYREAVVGRARVDIARDGAKAAVTRLEGLYDAGAEPALAVTYASALRRSERVEDARKVLEPLLGESASTEALVELAYLEWGEGRYEEARKAFQRAIALAPSATEPLLGSALLDVESGQASIARKSLDELVEAGNKSGKILVTAARVRILTGDAEGAKPILDEAAKVASWLGWEIARERGRTLLRRQQPIEAISELQRAQSLKPSDEETRILLMEAHSLAGNKRGSLRALEDITKSFRDSPLRSIAAGLHAYTDERIRDAIASFSEARSTLIDRNGARREQAHVAYWLGRCYEYDGNLTMAAEWLNKAVELDDSYAEAHYWLGQIYFQNKKTLQMIESYRKSVDIDPGQNPLAWFYLGQHYAATGNKDLAIAALDSFLKYWPEESGDQVIEAKTLLGQLR